MLLTQEVSTVSTAGHLRKCRKETEGDAGSDPHTPTQTRAASLPAVSSRHASVPAALSGDPPNVKLSSSFHCLTASSAHKTPFSKVLFLINPRTREHRYGGGLNLTIFPWCQQLHAHSKRM